MIGYKLFIINFIGVDIYTFKFLKLNYDFTDLKFQTSVEAIYICKYHPLFKDFKFQITCLILQISEI